MSKSAAAARFHGITETWESLIENSPEVLRAFEEGRTPDLYVPYVPSSDEDDTDDEPTRTICPSCWIETSVTGTCAC